MSARLADPQALWTGDRSPIEGLNVNGFLRFEAYPVRSGNETLRTTAKSPTDMADD